jgi:hypothetical protein
MEKIMENLPKPVSRKSNVVVHELEDEILIYDLNINKAFCLNQTSALIYQLCDGKNSVADISKLMSVKLKTLVSEDLVRLALEDFKKDNLLENGEELSSHFAGLSRREAIRKVGLASMITLPIIFSLVAPTAAMGQSTCGCANPGDCLTQTTCDSTVNCNASRRCAP